MAEGNMRRVPVEPAKCRTGPDAVSARDPIEALDERDRLPLSLKALGGGLWEYDVDADVMSCDTRWYEILGLDPAAQPVQSVADFRRYIHPDDVEKATNADDASALLAANEFYRVDFRIVRPDGEIRWLRSAAGMVRDQKSGHIRAIGCITDTTEFHQPPAAAAGAVEQLSERERECLSWVSMGKTAWETSVIVDRSRRTVEFHLNNAVHKLGATNKVHASAIAIRLGLL